MSAAWLSSTATVSFRVEEGYYFTTTTRKPTIRFKMVKDNNKINWRKRLEE